MSRHIELPVPLDMHNGVRVLFDIANPTGSPVYYYQPANDPARIYQVNFYTCNPLLGGSPATIPVVSLPGAMGNSTVQGVPGPDFQIQVTGVLGPPVGNADPDQVLWFRLATLTINGLAVYNHRLFLAPQANAWTNIPANLTVPQANIGTAVRQLVLRVGGAAQYVLNQYPINQAGPPSSAYLQQPF
jgi:hypothetical protein